MVKILKESRLHDMITTCRTCGCKFQFDISDCEIDSTRYADLQPFARVFQINCPTCKSSTKFEIMIQPEKEDTEDA